MCCDTLPQPQVGDPMVFHSMREVLALVKAWRAGNPRRPLGDAMCCPNDVANIGGRRCRREGEGICHGQNNPCLMYIITAPYFLANIPFIINNKKIKQKIEKLLEEDRKIERNRTKNTEAEIKKREAFEDTLNLTFDILKEDVRDSINACPVR